jgi:peptide/nickel transport system substrate-binding protein
MSTFLARLRSGEYLRRIGHTISSFSRPFWYVFFAFAALFAVTSFIFVHKFSIEFTSTVPVYGGTTSEGIVGTPRFVNPVLALSDADKDVTALVYSGLLRRTSDGELIPDLAESYSVSSDGLTYTFTLRKNIIFQDGTPVTSRDVAYTVSSVQDALKKSPGKVEWEGVTVNTPATDTVVFTLKQRYAGFLESTTLGILPAHLWEALTPEQFSLSDLNINGIGSGPYAISSIHRTKSGIPDSYVLSRNNKYALGKPYLRKITLHFFSNEEDLVRAFRSGRVDRVHAISPETAAALESEGFTVTTTVLPRVFGLYFNQNQNQLFADKAIREAINVAVDRDQIIKEVLGGYGLPATGPVPPGLSGEAVLTGQAQTQAPADPQKAMDILTKDGWKKNADGIFEKKDKKGTTLLSFSISTSDAPELRQAVNSIAENLHAVGMAVDVKVFETGTLNQSILRPRKYDVLFFGQVVNQMTDLLAFWHSSQRSDPGLNIALYTNPKADKLLEDAQKTLDEEKRMALYQSFLSEIRKDTPAVFLYHPLFIEASRGTLHRPFIRILETPSDRFADVYEWYNRTERVWNMFVNNN